MGDDGQRRAPAECWVSQERGGNEQSVGEVVETVADQDGECSFVRSVVMMSVRVIFAPVVSSVLVAFASTVMGMAPQGDFFQGEKTQDSSEQDREGFVRRQSLFQRFRQQMQQGHGQQQAGREADGQRDPLARQSEHDQRGGSDAEHAAEQAGKDDLGEEWGLHGMV